MDQERATIDKMINFIYYEAKEKINELKTKAIEDYNLEKSRLIKEKSDREELELKKELDKLHIAYLKQLSEIKLKYKLEMTKKKTGIVNAFFEKIANRLRHVRLNQQLIQQSTDMLDEKDLVVYVLDRDRERVRINAEIRRMDDEMVGGIVVCNRSGTVMVDNSYKVRLERVKRMLMPVVVKRLLRM